VRFLFYFLGQTREVYTVDISYNGGFVQTDVFPPLGSFIILEHYHLKKRNVTLGLVGKIRRIQTPFQSSPSVRGVGVEWVRCYCNQGFLPLKQFLERDLGYQPFDWDTHLTYEEYDRKIVYDFATSALSPTPQELDAILGTRRRTRREAEATAPGPRPEANADASDSVARRPTRPVLLPEGTVRLPSGLRPGFAEDAEFPGAADSTAAATEPPAGAGQLFAARLGEVDPLAKTLPPTTSVTPRYGVSGPSAPPTPPATAAPDAEGGAPADDGTADADTPSPAARAEVAGDLFPVEIKVVFGIGNRMFYGVVRGLSEHELAVETTTAQVVKANAHIQVRLPLNAKNYRYMVVIYGRVLSIDETNAAAPSFRLRIETLDEFQNPGGFRFFLQTLAR